MKTALLSILALSVAACAAPTSSSSEDTGQASQAATTGGITASVVKTSETTTTYFATVTVTNNGTAPANNWQVSVDMRESTLLQGTVGAEVFAIAGMQVFAPTTPSDALNPGETVSFKFSATKNGPHYNPVIHSVDGLPSGTAGNTPDHVDHVARGAATAALQLALAYENNKLPNNGDPDYATYDALIWSSQPYVISSDGSQIEFDSYAPGYGFVPDAAKAELAFAQLDPSVASYLVAGLASCFAGQSGGAVYNFNAAPLKGYKYSRHTQTAYVNASGNTGVDKVTLVGSTFNGGEQISMNETQSSGKDWAFGLLTTTSFYSFDGITGTLHKYHSGNNVPCSPFNGPGGAMSNPYLVMTLNGSQLGPRQQVAPLQCQNLVCTASVTVDPVAYATAGDYYDNYGNMVGPQPNPFTLDPTVMYAISDHQSQYSINPYAQYGTFSKAVTLFGTTKYKFNLCGNYGSGC